MFKLLLLCLLATHVTTGEPTTKHSEVTHLLSTTSTEKHHETSPTKDPETSRAADAHTKHPHTEHATDAHTRPHSQSEHTAPPTVPLTCHCTGGLDCQENHRCTTKDSKRFCVSMAETNNLDEIQHSTNQTCGENIDLCNTTITITLKETFFWRSHIECCHDIDNCNSRTISAPQKDTALGKVECPSCFVVNESSCKPGRMKCAATETKCIDVAGTVKNGNKTETFVGKGCATPSAAHIRSGTILSFGDVTYSFTKSTVTDDASQTPKNVPFILLLSSFVVLLQAKFIY